MNAKERRELGYFPKAIDQAIKDRFGIQSKTSFDLFGSMGYTTWFEADDPVLKQRVEDFIAGYIAGNKELATRLLNPDLFLG